jgi:hypothetical protein
VRLVYLLRSGEDGLGLADLMVAEFEPLACGPYIEQVACGPYIGQGPYVSGLKLDRIEVFKAMPQRR